MDLSVREHKKHIDCWSAMDKIVTHCASRVLRGTKSTPGFCSQNIEIVQQLTDFDYQERLQAHHAAMDFTGSGGRIISDPQEAALIARTSIRLRSFPICQSSPRSSSKSSLEDTTSLDLATPPCSQVWFRPNMGREQANTALFPHRNRDGVFLIRPCSRQTHNYVLSFTSNSKIVHAQIVRVSHDGKNAFSLDGARTKFPSLEHLVDFHKMNCGALPGLLQDTPTGPDTSVSPALARPDTEHYGGQLERDDSS